MDTQGQLEGCYDPKLTFYTCHIVSNEMTTLKRVCKLDTNKRLMDVIGTLPCGWLQCFLE